MIEAIQRLQPMDYVLVLVWAGIIAWGVSTGIIRQAALVVAAYAAAASAGALYKPLGNSVSFGTGVGNLSPLEVIAYALVYFAVLVALAVLLRWAYPHTRLRNARGWDRVGGATLAAAWGLMLLIAVVTMLRFYAIAPWPGQNAAQFEVNANLARSRLLPVLAVATGPLWQGLAVWFPEPVLRSFR